jgi:SurA-like N-terminal domain/PPIC-type PPIASE domain
MSMAKNKISRTFVWIIMGLVLVGLVGFGSFNFGGGVTAIGKVGDTEIGADRYFREVNAQLNAIQAEAGQRLTFAQAQSFGLDRAALETVIGQVALENETARLGVSVGDAELAARIRDISAFAGIDGSFDRETYQFVLQQSGLTAGDFEESLRSEVARMILQSAVTNGIAVPATYTDTLYGWVREARDFTWAKVDASVLDTPVGTPDEAALTAYYEANPEAFTLPQTRKITYVWLRPEDVIDQIEVTDDELRALYDDRIDEFTSPERRLVERLVFGSEADAEAAAARLADGSASFEDLVADRGLTLADIDLGDVTVDELGSAGEAVFALDAPGAVAGPVTTDLGPALFRMNAILNAHETTFDEARDGLKADYAADAARRLLSDMVTELDDALAGGATLEDLASEHGMTLAQLDWTGGESDGIAAYDAFREAATLVEDGDYPEINDLSDGGLFALRLDEVVAPRLQSLDEVRAAAIAGWQAQETVARVVARAEEMIGEMSGGASPASLGLTEIVETGQTRDAYIDGTPPAMVEQVFALDETGAWQVVEDADGAVLIRLDAIHSADQVSQDALALKAAFSQSTAQALALDVQSAFSAAIEAEAGIVLDQAMINAVNASFQ